MCKIFLTDFAETLNILYFCVCKAFEWLFCYVLNYSGLQCLFSWQLCTLDSLVTFFSLLLLYRTLGQNEDNERNYDVENDVNLAKSLQQYLKYLRILSQSASKNLYPRKTSDKASVKVVFLMWFLHSLILASFFSEFSFLKFPLCLQTRHCFLLPPSIDYHNALSFFQNYSPWSIVNASVCQIWSILP